MFKLVSTDYCGYAAEGDFVLYSPVNKQTFLLPGYTESLLEHLRLCFPSWVPIFDSEQSVFVKSTSEDVIKTITFLLQHDVIEERE